MIPSVNISQANAIDAKANNWRKYLDKLAIDIQKGEINQFYMFKVASLWASTFAYIEWLVSFYEAKTFPSISEIAQLLNEAWGWDKELGKLFWKSGRHPFAHVGQANNFYSYGRYDSLETNINFDAGFWSNSVTDDWDKYHKYKAVAILPPLSTEDQTLQIIYFHNQMIRSELLPILSVFVTDSIRTETSEARLEGIIKLNRQILH